jgi:hypothetical protein
MKLLNRATLALASLVLFAGFAATAFAYTPTLAVSSTGTADNVQINVSGASPSSSVILYYSKVNVGETLLYLGNTDSNGNYTTTISTGTNGISPGGAVYVMVNGTQSPTVTWPSTTATGLFSLSQTGVVITSGQSVSITANNTITTSNPSGAIYVSNNSNPPIANVNISGSQITINAISNGSTVVSICSGSSSTCASVYVTVGSSSGQPLTFSISSVTVAPGQSVPITVTGGTGSYTILNNSNSSVIQAGVNGSIVTLTTSSSSGTASITVCSSDMSSCGIINAAAGTASSAPLAFSQNNPILATGQSLTIALTGGYASGATSASYYISSNSNTGAVAASISGNNLIISGNSNGTSTITVCSSAGSCGSITATVSYTSSGGNLQLSQSTISLLAGQVLTVAISGGITPYSLSGGNGTIAQTSLNGNTISVSGLSAGSSSVEVCSAGSACLPLSIIVNASGSGTALTFNPSSVSVAVGGSSSVVISGGGGYYPSSSSNPAVATVQISGNSAVVSGLTAGSDNISICQSSGQCAILFVSVGGSAAAGSNPVFSQTNPNVGIGQTLNLTISGGITSNYYVLSNTNANVVQLSLNNSQLALTGVSQGASTVVICAASTSCASVVVNVGTVSTTPLVFQTTSLPAPSVSQAYTAQLSVSGGSGSYTYTVTSGSLPAGLALSSGGLISGLPTAAGAVSFTVTAADASNPSSTISEPFSLTVSTALAVPTPTPTPTPTSAPSTSGTYSNGQLINENGTIYIVYQNTKVGFANAPAFLGLGFSFSNVTTVSDSGLTVSPKVVVTDQGEHPRGTWVLSGATVYFVTPSGLIPVSDWNTFLGNGGQAGFIVPADSYDRAAPQLPVMTANDARLQP